MMHKTVVTLAGIAMLNACGGSGSNPFDTVDDPVVDLTVNGVTSNADGSFTIVDDAMAFELSTSSTTLNGQTAWITGSERAGSFIDDNVTAIGGFLDGEPFSGITGTLAAAPTGDATFSGRFDYITETSASNGALDLIFGLDDNTLQSDIDNDLLVDGTVADDGSITGTVAFDGVTTNFNGGFFGTNAVAGTFDDETAAGVFYGTN